MALDTTKTAHEIINSGRSTGQTVIDKDGNLKWAIENRTQTDLDNAAEWTLVNMASSVETGVNANGKKRYLLTEDATASVNHYIGRNVAVTAGETYTIAAIVESNGRNAVIALGAPFGSDRWAFDLATLTVVRQSGTSTTSTATATALTNGEVSIEFTATSTGTQNANVQFRLWDGGAGDADYNGDGTSGLYVSEVKVYQSTIGPRELVTDGAFSSGITGWVSPRANSTLSHQTDKLRSTATAPGAYGASYAIGGLVVGKEYRFNADILTDTLGDDVLVRAWSTVDLPGGLYGVAAGATASLVFTATATLMYVGFIQVAAAGGDYIEVDNISVVPLVADAMQRDKFGSNFLENETGAALYGPGIDYSTGRGGLQVYEGATNLNTSFEVSTANWISAATATLEDQTLNVLGAFRGCKVTNGVPTNGCARSPTLGTVTSGTDYVVTALWSDTTTDGLYIRTDETGVGSGSVTITTAGVFTQTSATKGPCVLLRHRDLGGGLYLSSIKWTPNFTGGGSFGLGPKDGVEGDSVIVYAGQVHMGAFEAPLIPTYGSTMTHGADTLSTLISSFGYNVNAGTVVVEFATNSLNFLSYDRVYQLGSITDAKISLELGADNLMRTYVDNEATLSLGANPAPGVSSKVAHSFKTDDFGASRDGGAAVTDTSGVLPTVNTAIFFGSDVTGKHLNGLIYSLLYFPFAATDKLVEASS